MSKITNLFIFAAGAAIGSAVTWKILKTKYERLAQEEIDSVKEVFSRRAKQTDELADNVDQDRYENILKDEGYVQSSDIEEKEVPSKMRAVKPYVITPEEFGDQDGYDISTLTYYSDGVLTDDFDEVIEDIEGLVGEDSLEHFGEYEDDSVFVRNDISRTDYEILRDERSYSEVVGTSPYTSEAE